MFLGAIGSLREFQLQDKSLKRFPWLFRDDLLIYDVDEVNKRLAADNANITKLTNVIASHASLYAAFVQSVPMNGPQVILIRMAYLTHGFSFRRFLTLTKLEFYHTTTLEFITCFC